jgi:dihydroxyacetone kinase-like protein
VTDLDGPAFARMVAAAADAVDREAAALSKLDAVAGDGDHGVNLQRAMAAARRALGEAEPIGSPGEQLQVVAEACTEQMGGAAGALFGAFFAAAAGSMGERAAVDADALAQALATGTERVRTFGKADVGDKTMIDALVPAAEAAAAAATSGAGPVQVLRAAADAAHRGAGRTRDLTPAAGRARYAAERATGSADPGATSMALILDAFAHSAANDRGR